MSHIQSEGYKRFRGWVAQQKIAVDSTGDKVWKYYDYGPKEEAPIIFIPGAGGTAEVFYKQFLSLCPKGYRVISVQPPDYMTHETWCKGMERFLDRINVEKAHLFGTSVGGFSAQAFVQFRPQRVLSLVLCNTFSDTSYYKEHAPCAEIFPWMPEFMLKRVILSNFPEGKMEAEIANSIDFMVLQLEELSQKELASRLTLNTTLFPLKPSEWKWDKRKITIIDTLDEVAVNGKLREEVYKYYPEAKVAELKTGGNFPYLSRADEFNMYIQVHLRSAANMEPPSSPEVERVAAPQRTSKEEEEEVPLQRSDKKSSSLKSSGVEPPAAATAPAEAVPKAAAADPEQTITTSKEEVTADQQSDM
eukprot:TRINITY_DN14495_c0_g1_i1.p1 TRINITY_DN14495_c0_g1~~TRINITY_DN14495_c0_g1_i1.p1  ORF type:complete len:361 (+),score=92.61 TRINITY_DN14495_c0_g1_i1:102-1184(+)